jgi:hypothetical protein
MSRQILLARPHPFIVAEMKPFLEANDFSALKPEVPQSLDALARGCAGAIISLAVTSSINLEIDEVIKQVRSKVPKLPLVFAGLLPFEKYQQTLERLAQQTGLAGEGLAVSAVTEGSKTLGTPEGWLYVSKDDLADPLRRELAARLFKRHFR